MESDGDEYGLGFLVPYVNSHKYRYDQTSDWISSTVTELAVS